MKRFLTAIMLMTTLGGLLLPMRATSALSGPEICDAAAEGDPIPGYEEVLHALPGMPLNGGSGSQVLLGTSGPDTLRGGSGNDVLCGFGGNDTLIGGSGNDLIIGGEGVDDLRGNSGNDTFYSDADDERIRGGSGRDRTMIATPTPTQTATDVPPTATDVPPTATDVPPTATDVPPTATDVPPTATDVPSGPRITIELSEVIAEESQCSYIVTIAGVPAGTTGRLVIQEAGVGTVSSLVTTIPPARYGYFADFGASVQAQFDFDAPGLETISSGFTSCPPPGFPTATDVPPTATDVPPTATDVPPTATDVPPTATDVPPTATIPGGAGEPTVRLSKTGGFSCGVVVTISQFQPSPYSGTVQPGNHPFSITTNDMGDGTSDPITGLNSGTTYSATVNGVTSDGFPLECFAAG